MGSARGQLYEWYVTFKKIILMYKGPTIARRPAGAQIKIIWAPAGAQIKKKLRLAGVPYKSPKICAGRGGSLAARAADRGNEIRYVEGRVARPHFDGFRYDKYPKTRNSFLRDLLYK